MDFGPSASVMMLLPKIFDLSTLIVRKEKMFTWYLFIFSLEVVGFWRLFAEVVFIQCLDQDLESVISSLATSL
eukprot:snap_masked-scaffold_14-processed-gene-3.22-mRNA-1 protein AED:1.00 eAED:1.00 QI:0/0/0/0/1/1/2/0/72